MHVTGSLPIRKIDKVGKKTNNKLFSVKIELTQHN